MLAEEISMLHNIFVPSKFGWKLLKYYLKRIYANVEILWEYSNHMWWFKIPSIKKPGMKIIRKNELSIICNLNIKYLVWNQHISITGPREMSNFHQILQQQINVKILHLFFALTPIQMCLMKLDVQFV